MKIKFCRKRVAGMYSAMPICLCTGNKPVFFYYGLCLSLTLHVVLLIKFHLLLQAIVEIAYIFSQSVVYGVIVYAMIDFEWIVAKFFWYLLFMFFTLLYFTFFGMMAVAATPNQHIAAAFYGLWNLFSGFIVSQTVSALSHCCLRDCLQFLKTIFV